MKVLVTGSGRRWYGTMPCACMHSIACVYLSEIVHMTPMLKIYIIELVLYLSWVDISIYLFFQECLMYYFLYEMFHSTDFKNMSLHAFITIIMHSLHFCFCDKNIYVLNFSFLQSNHSFICNEKKKLSFLSALNCVSAYSDETTVALSAVWVSSLTVNALCQRTLNPICHSFTCMAWPLLLNLSH